MPSLYDPTMTGAGGGGGGGGAAAAGMATMNPWLAGGGMALDFLGAGLFGGGQDPKLSNLHLVNPGQLALWNQMAKRVATGSGESGFGAAAKSAKGTIQQMMENSGVSQDSGVAQSLQAQGIGAAAASDQANRNALGMSLLQTPIQTAQTAGANLIPGSPSAGYSQGAQEASWNQTQRTGYVPGGIGGQYNGQSWGSRPDNWAAQPNSGAGRTALANAMGRRSGRRNQFSGVGNG